MAPLNKKQILKLISEARKVSQRAYAPFSKYKVGAALLDSAGKIFVGCNVENSSYGATLCAERGAIARAIAEGAKKILAMAIVSEGKTPPYPCGICRQMISEFSHDLEIMIVHKKKMTLMRLSDLYPNPFSV
ncbi:MAG: cytidine deaminase [Deltaproteobacteria bacterium]|nr:cytidine deaminase [Deltaproteobacteria bacterium]